MSRGQGLVVAWGPAVRRVIIFLCVGQSIVKVSVRRATGGIAYIGPNSLTLLSEYLSQGVHLCMISLV